MSQIKLPQYQQPAGNDQKRDFSNQNVLSQEDDNIWKKWGFGVIFAANASDKQQSTVFKNLRAWASVKHSIKRKLRIDPDHLVLSVIGCIDADDPDPFVWRKDKNDTEPKKWHRMFHDYTDNTQGGKTVNTETDDILDLASELQGMMLYSDGQFGPNENDIPYPISKIEWLEHHQDGQKYYDRWEWTTETFNNLPYSSGTSNNKKILQVPRGVLPDIFIVIDKSSLQELQNGPDEDVPNRKIPMVAIVNAHLPRPGQRSWILADTRMLSYLWEDVAVNSHFMDRLCTSTLKKEVAVYNGNPKGGKFIDPCRMET